MIQLNKILTPVDGSDHSMRAARYAAALAGMVDAEIILVHCHKPFPVILGDPYYQKAVIAILEKSNEMLEPFRQLYLEHNLRFSERILEEPAGKAITEVSEIEHCDLIIMGSRGHSDLKGLVIGSVAHRVLHSVTCPVLIVR